MNLEHAKPGAERSASARLQVSRWGLGLLVALVAGCTTYVTPPAHPADPVPVIVPNYGRHTSVVLPCGPNEMTEYAFGDWDFFALGHNSIWVGLRALFLSPQSTLGRRVIEFATTQPDVRTQLGAKEVLVIEVERSKAVALLARLDLRYAAEEGTIHYNAPYQMYFVPDDERYCATHNCNHVTKQWLKELGCDVDGLAFTSDFRLVKPTTTTTASRSTEPAGTVH